MPKTKYKKRADGRYRGSVVVGKTKEGKEIRKYAYGHTITELENNLSELRVLYNKGVVIRDEGLTLAEWSDTWLKTYKCNVEDNTKKMYEDCIRLYIKPEIGHLKLKNIKENHISSLLEKMQNRGIGRRTEMTLLTIKQILKKAVKNDYISKNVAEDVTLNKRVIEEKRPLSTEELRLVEKVARNHKYGTFIMTIIYTGMRREEIVPLTFKDIDLINHSISINKAVYFEKGKVNKIKSTKNKRTRTVPILNNIYPLLSKLKSKAHSDNELVFPKKDGQIRTESSLKRTLESFLLAVNKEYEKQQKELNKDFVLTDENKIHFSYHPLRHTFACILYKANVPLKDAQELMGHQDIKILLNIYTHLDKQDKENARNKLNEFINSKNKIKKFTGSKRGQKKNYKP